MQQHAGTKGAIAETFTHHLVTVDSTKAVLILSPCRKRSQFGMKSWLLRMMSQFLETAAPGRASPVLCMTFATPPAPTCAW